MSQADQLLQVHRQGQLRNHLLPETFPDPLLACDEQEGPLGQLRRIFDRLHVLLDQPGEPLHRLPHPLVGVRPKGQQAIHPAGRSVPLDNLGPGVRVGRPLPN